MERLFCNPAQLGKEVGLVLNFEARGTSGPSYMLMETNGKWALLKNLLQQTLLSSIKLIDVQYL
jgi:hypothetical protein